MQQGAATTLALTFRGLSRFIECAGLSFKAHAILFVFPLLYLAGNELLLSGIVPHRGTSWSNVFLAAFQVGIPAALFTMLLIRLFQYLFLIKPASPIRALLDDIASLFRSPKPFLNALPVILVMVMFNKAMLDLKPSISQINPFSWDLAFAEFDRALHFGIDPWRLLQPFLGYTVPTAVINFAYCFWFLALFTSNYWFAFQREYTELRIRFFIATMMAWWIGGGLMAVYFSSAGPAYYGLIGLTPDPFTPLMAYLRQVDEIVPIWALDAQRLLWDTFTAPEARFLGISAFPSMHNAVAVIIALAGFKVRRSVGWALTAYAFLIFLGSVHLGWHYAVDSYAAIAIALIAWYIAGPLARLNQRLPWVKNYKDMLAG
ncbi:MAG: phosphatase PAP2 family protein [Aestuariivirgaceae bacterium]